MFGFKRAHNLDKGVELIRKNIKPRRKKHFERGE